MKNEGHTSFRETKRSKGLLKSMRKSLAKLNEKERKAREKETTWNEYFETHLLKSTGYSVEL